MAAQGKKTFPENRDDGTGRPADWLLGGLLSLLALLLFLGYHVANLTPGETASSPSRAPAASTAARPDAGQPPPDRSWEEKTGRWQETLQESSAVLRRDKSREGAAPGEEGQDQVELDSLDESVGPGDFVDVVWRSPDGSLWKKVLDHPLEVQEATRGAARVAVTPEEARAIESARSEGRVFIAPK